MLSLNVPFVLLYGLVEVNIRRKGWCVIWACLRNTFRRCRVPFHRKDVRLREAYSTFRRWICSHECPSVFPHG